MEFLQENLIYSIPLMGIFGLLIMMGKAAWVSKQDAGDEKMAGLAKHIADGALSFLKAEWKVMSYFVIIAALLLAYSGTLIEHSSWIIAIAFLIGAFLSAFAGFIGMRIATKANVRTTQAARTSLPQALKVSFTGGSVMGLGVAGLAVLGLGSLFIVFFNMFVPAGAAITGVEMRTAIEVLTGFSLGSESIALFARVGGGIYTKAADVGADLVGKVEAGIPEDDPRNPATIADNVGDNVGDVAGMGADLFGSYVATILATMVLGQEINSADNFGGMAPILLPMVIAGIGLLVSAASMILIKISGEDSSVQKAFNIGNWTSIILVTIISYPLTQWMMPESMVLRGHEFTSMGVFYAIVVGSVVGALMSWVTEYYTAMGKKPVNDIVQQSATGHATNIISGLALGMQSTVIPILILSSGIILSYYFAGLYGVAIAAAGMMATTAMQLAIDAFGPIADNAGGIAEMSRLPKEVRGRTDNLDAVGNTTAATGKGFAIASAALTALALFAAYVGIAGIDSIDIFKAPVLAMLFIGAMIPFIFSSLAIAAVGRAAMAMVHEVRRQFKEIPGIMEYEAEPEYEKCVEISTKASLREMMLPGAIALITPVIVGFGFQGVFENVSSAEMLGGLLAGVTVSGVLMGLFQNNAGGAWDNAKKSFEEGVEINGKMEYKGSEAHKASVTGDTVGDPFKDTSGPSMNILIKLMSIVALIIAPHIAVEDHGAVAVEDKVVVVEEIAMNDLAELTGIWGIDNAHTYVDFSIRHFIANSKGTVNSVNGTIDFGDDYHTGNIDIVLDVNSMDTGNEDRDEHLMSDDFFDVVNYPNITFKSSTIERLSDGYLVKGLLTIKDKTGDAQIKFEYLGSQESPFKEGLFVGALQGVMEIDRNNFGLTGYSGVLGDEIQIVINSEIDQDRSGE